MMHDAVPFDEARHIIRLLIRLLSRDTFSCYCHCAAFDNVQYTVHSEVYIAHVLVM